MPSFEPGPLNTSYHTSGDPQTGGASERYGRAGVVPWSFAQTLRGAALTLVPWFAFIVAAQIGAPAGGATRHLTRGQDVAQGLSALVVTALLEGVFLIAPLYYAIGRSPADGARREGLRALGFRPAPLGASLGLVAGGIAAVYVVSYLYGVIVERFHLPLHTNVEALQAQVHAEPITVLCTLAGAVIIAPICEEVFFRGYLFAGLLRGMNVLPAAITSALLFVAAHGDLGSAVPLLALGILLAVLRWRTGSIWPGIALHVGNNALASIYVIAVLLGH